MTVLYSADRQNRHRAPSSELHGAYSSLHLLPFISLSYHILPYSFDRKGRAVLELSYTPKPPHLPYRNRRQARSRRILVPPPRTIRLVPFPSLRSQCPPPTALSLGPVNSLPTRLLHLIRLRSSNWYFLANRVWARPV